MWKTGRSLWGVWIGGSPAIVEKIVEKEENFFAAQFSTGRFFFSTGKGESGAEKFPVFSTGGNSFI